MINDREILDNVEILYDKKVIIYGASLSGIRVRDMLKEIEVDIVGYADSDVRKCMLPFENKKVYSLTELKNLSEYHYIIIIASMYREEIVQSLEEEKIRLSAYSWQIVELSMKVNRDNKRIPELFRKKIDYIYWLEACCETREREDKEILKNCLLSTCRNPVYVYQMGKVASSSIYYSLKGYNYLSAYHFHHVERNGEILKTYRKLMQNKKIKIITCVREAISRMLSNIIQDIERNLRLKKQQGVYNTVAECLRACCEYEKKMELGKDGLYLGAGYSAFLWFENELKQTFGIDVFHYKFDREAGYTIIYQDNIEILLLKTEKINQLETVIGNFVGIKEFKLTNANVGSEKFYKYLYDDVKKNIKIPKYIFDFYYQNNPKMDHFYTEEEKQQFYKKWQNNIDFSSTEL